MERRYASILSTSFICFTYGLTMPILFVVFTVILLFQVVMDKLLITYFYKERVEHNDLLNRTLLIILKYALFIYMFIGGIAMSSNYNTIDNDVIHPLKYSNE